MKTILCFGDSNTHGTDPSGGPRLGPEVRWPGVMRAQLGAGYQVIEEGCGGRTTVWDDPVEVYPPSARNGSVYLPPCLQSHKPIDLVIILLGTNDLKTRFSVGAFDIAAGAGMLVKIIRASESGPGGKAPQVLLLAPPPLAPLTNVRVAAMRDGGEEKSRQLGDAFRFVAAELACPCLDLGQVIVSSPVDGVHFDPPEHAKLGKAVALQVRKMLG